MYRSDAGPPVPSRDKKVRSWSRAARLRLSVVAVLLGALSLGTGRLARACSGGTTSINARAVLPADGTTGVPLNARILVRYSPTVAPIAPPAPNIRVRPQGGEPIALVQTAGMAPGLTLARPDANLLPNTVYEILDSILVPCLGLECVAGDHRVVATFTTGASVDTTPPVFAGPMGFEVSWSNPLSYPAICTGGQTFAVRLHWTAGTDDLAPTLTYNVYGSTQTVPVIPLVTGDNVLDYVRCTSRPTGALVGPIRVRAVDQAGNEDSNLVELVAPNPCAPDGGVADAAADVSSAGTGGAGGVPADAAVDVPGSGGAGGVAGTGGGSGTGGAQGGAGAGNGGSSAPADAGRGPSGGAPGAGGTRGGGCAVVAQTPIASVGAMLLLLLLLGFARVERRANRGGARVRQPASNASSSAHRA